MSRLVDFNPHWITLNNSIVPFYFGVSFMCPAAEGDGSPLSFGHLLILITGMIALPLCHMRDFIAG